MLFSERENNGFYTTRFGKRSAPSVSLYDLGEPQLRQKKSHNKNEDHSKTTLNQEVAAYAVEGNDFNGSPEEEEEGRVELRLREEEEPQQLEGVVRTTPLGRPPSVQPRNIEGT